MKNADTPINGEFKQAGDTAIKKGGLTKREHFAALAMQGILSAPRGKFPDHDNEWAVVKDSVILADALLDALEGES